MEEILLVNICIMKIAIFTFGHSFNCGTSLQAFALQKTIQRLDPDGDCVLINHYTKKPDRIPLFVRKPSIKYLKGYIYLKGARKAQRDFLNNNAVVRPKKPLMKDELSAYVRDFDYVIAGSDQVWNPVFTPGEHPLRFLLDFVEDDNKKLAYAPSLGVKELPEAYIEEFQYYLKKFKHLSVRETAGQELINRLTGICPPVVVDPTFLLNKEEWSQYKTLLNKKDYIFLYEKEANPELEQFAYKLGEKKGLKVIRKRYADLALEDDCGLWFIHPGHWIDLIANASYVVTSSFHGVAFSINFNKQFFVLNSGSTSSRVDELLNRFNLQSRRVGLEAQDVDEQIDYSKINTALDEWRKHSFDILSAFLKK